MMTRERNIQHAIREALGLHPDVVLWRNNVGEAVYPDGARVRYGLAEGSADLVGICRMPDGTGRFFALEVKSTRGQATPEQLRWMRLVRMGGGFAAVVRSPEEALAAVERCQAGERE